jgi:DNA-binding transcriptional regulator YiaG
MTITEPANDALFIALVRRLIKDGSAQRIREEAQLSLGDVGRALGGVTASTVMRWERGSLPRSGMAIRYGQLLARLADLDAETPDPS